MKKDFICLVLNAGAHRKGTLSRGVSELMQVFIWGVFGRGGALLRSVAALDSSKLGWQPRRRKGQGVWMGVSLARKWY